MESRPLPLPLNHLTTLAVPTPKSTCTYTGGDSFGAAFVHCQSHRTIHRPEKSHRVPARERKNTKHRLFVKKGCSPVLYLKKIFVSWYYHLRGLANMCVSHIGFLALNSPQPVEGRPCIWSVRPLHRATISLVTHNFTKKDKYAMLCI